MNKPACRRRSLAGLVVAIAAAVLSVPGGAEPGVTVRAAELRQSPATDARPVASLPAQAQVDIVRREGAWVQVKAGGASGWLRLFDVRLAAAAGTPAKASGGSSLSQTLALASGARSTTATTGVRGLDEEMLKTATPNLTELTTLDGFAATSAEAQAFATQGSLVARSIEPLKTAGGK